MIGRPAIVAVPDVLRGLGFAREVLIRPMRIEFTPPRITSKVPRLWLEWCKMSELEQSISTPLEDMIQAQVVSRGITDQRVLNALRAVPRQRFFPEDLREEAFADRAAPIGHGQTISQPYMVALMTERLDLRPEHKVLEIGTGSGYHAAILAQIARDVYTIERVKPLLDDAFHRLSDLG